MEWTLFSQGRFPQCVCCLLSRISLIIRAAAAEWMPGCSSLVCMSLWRLLAGSLFAVVAFGAQVDANAIIRHSVEVLKKDFEAAPRYDNFERDGGLHRSKTYQVMMILGSPYRRLVAVNGVKLSPQDRQKEEQKLEHEVAERCAESQSQREKRLQDYEKDRQRDHRMMEQLTKAFDFRLLSQQTLNGRKTWILSAYPRPGYQPPNDETKALTGMRGKLWIDEATFQWVKVYAWVIRPVSIEGFLATVEPGTQFELERSRVAEGVWLPSHFSERANAEILSFIAHRSYDNETYFDYQAADQVKTPACTTKITANGPARS